MSLVLGHDKRSNLITVLFGCWTLWQWVYRGLINSWFIQLKEICLSKKVNEGMSNNNLFPQNTLMSTSALHRRGLRPNCNFTYNFRKTGFPSICHAFKVWAFLFIHTDVCGENQRCQKARWFPLDADPCAGFHIETGAPQNAAQQHNAASCPRRARHMRAGLVYRDPMFYLACVKVVQMCTGTWANICVPKGASKNTYQQSIAKRDWWTLAGRR